LTDIIPESGNTTKGNKAVTEIETASVIHQQIIQVAKARTMIASFDRENKAICCTSKKSMGPNMSPTFLVISSGV
jgi:hypothetical protein